MSYYGGGNVGTQIYDVPTLGENVGTKARGDWEQVVFLLD